MLQIGVHHHHGVAGGVIDPGGERHLVPEVARQESTRSAGSLAAKRFSSASVSSVLPSSTSTISKSRWSSDSSTGRSDW